MDRVIIIGNGFDLANGFNTDYHRFLKYMRGNHESFMKESQILRQYENFSSFGWGDIEYIYFQTLYKIATKTRITEELRIKEAIKLNDELSLITEKLIEYLHTEVSNNKVKLEKIGPYTLMGGILNGINTPFETIFDGLDETHIINFNYTDYFNRYHLSNQFKYYHVHGNISYPNSIIFGYGNQLGEEYAVLENMNHEAFLKNIKYHKYLQYDHAKNLLAYLSSENTEEYFVDIIGHSCGLCDKTLLSEIFDNTRCVKIRIFHRDSYDDFHSKALNISRHISNKMDLVRKVELFDPKLKIPQIPSI